MAIWSPNTWHWVVACLAIHHAGGRHGAAEHPLHRRRGRRHPGPHRRAGAVRDGPVPRQRPRRPTWTATPCPRCGTSCESRSRPTRLSAPGTSSSPAVPNPEPPMRCRPRRRRRARRRQRHPVHLRHHRPQQRRAVRAPAIAVGLGVVGRQRQNHQRRPLPVHQPVLPQLRLQGRHPGLPADRCDADPAPDLRSAAHAAGHRATPHHRVARTAHHLPDAARPSGAPRLRPELAAVRGDRRGHRAGRAGGTHAVRTRHRHRADRLRPDRGQRHGHHVPRRRRRRDRRHHLRAPVRRLRIAHRHQGPRTKPARCCCAGPT